MGPPGVCLGTATSMTASAAGMGARGRQHRRRHKAL